MKYFNLHAHQGHETIQDELAVVSISPDEARTRAFSFGDAFYSVGIHPLSIVREKLDEQISRVEKLSGDREFRAVGECGLHRSSGAPPLDEQAIVFIRHAEISEKTGKPLIIHCVRSFPELIRIKKKLRPASAWIIHGFRGNETSMRQLVDNGFYLSFGAALLCSPKTKTVFRDTPLDRIFLETDEDSRSIAELYAEAAELKKMKLEDFIAAVSVNADRLFRCGA